MQKIGINVLPKEVVLGAPNVAKHMRLPRVMLGTGAMVGVAKMALDTARIAYVLAESWRRTHSYIAELRDAIFPRNQTQDL